MVAEYMLLKIIHKVTIQMIYCLTFAAFQMQMAVAFKEAVICGRRAYEAGLGTVSDNAEASSPLTAFLNS